MTIMNDTYTRTYVKRLSPNRRISDVDIRVLANGYQVLFEMSAQLDVTCFGFDTF